MPEEALLDVNRHAHFNIYQVSLEEAEAGQSLEEFTQYLPFPPICSSAACSLLH